MNDKPTVRWLIPFPIRASGGHGTIYAHMERMVADGFHCIACVDLRDMSSPFSSRRARLHELQALLTKKGIEVAFGHHAVAGQADMAVATSWRTAFDVATSAAPRKAYFIQDYEPWFFPHGDRYMKAELSYRLGLTPVVLGRWLAGKVGSFSDRLPFVMPFSVDGRIYVRAAASARSKAICYLHQPEKPRRCTTLAQAALRIVRAQRPDIAVWSYGSSRPPEFSSKHLGLLSREACASLYNEAAVGLCISASNPSRIPFEMAACGLPVVDIDAENTRADALPDAFLLASPEPAALATALIRSVDEERFRALAVPSTNGRGEPDELEVGARAFRRILQEPPSIIASALVAAEPDVVLTRWRSLRRRLVKAYVAFGEDD